jgi:two-component system, NtrC family, sensor histidine kinase HydH
MSLATRTVTSAGTTLAPDVVVPEAPTHTDVWRGRRNFFFAEEARSTSRWAMAIGGFLHIASVGVFALAGYPTWRWVAIGVLYLVFATAQRLLVRRADQPQCVEASFLGMNLCAQVFVTTCAALTGGIHSPFVPALALPSIVSLLFFGPIAASRWIALCNGLLVAGMALLPGSIVGPPVPDLAYIVNVIQSLGFGIFMLHMMAGKLAHAATRAGDSYDCLREERVAEAEAQLRRLQSVGAKVAHELKNPLASIKGLCQLVARAPESERTQERLAVVSSEISRMETILNEYLSFSRPLEDLNPESFDVTALGKDVLNVLAGRADQAGVTLALEGNATQVQGDPRRLKEALINLVANAIEATPTGGNVQLRVKNGGGTITLEVKDSGRGITPDDLERLGTSFFTTRPNGTGLGVVLAQGVITQHGGSLSYASRVGHGTTATISLPGKASASPEPAARAAMIEARA